MVVSAGWIGPDYRCRNAVWLRSAIVVEPPANVVPFAVTVSVLVRAGAELIGDVGLPPVHLPDY